MQKINTEKNKSQGNEYNQNEHMMDRLNSYNS